MEDFVSVRHYFSLGLQHGGIISFSPPCSFPKYMFNITKFSIRMNCNSV